MPTPLEEAFLELDQHIPEEDVEYLNKAPNLDQAATRLHHSLGMFIRNHFGLWGDSSLATQMKTEFRIKHPDDMSHYIIVEYIRHKIPTRFERIR